MFLTTNTCFETVLPYNLILRLYYTFQLPVDKNKKLDVEESKLF